MTSHHLDCHLDRPLAPSGIRRSKLICLSAAGRSVSMELAAAWSVQCGEGASLFCVGSGSRLAGTTVLMRERPSARAEMWIWLPTSKAVRKLDSAQVDDWVLGSDFVYDDFRIWTPRVFTETAPSGSAVAGGTAFHGEYTWRREAIKAEALLDTASGLLRSAAWTRRGETSPLRQLEAKRIVAIGGTATPRELAVVREGGFESRMELLGQACDASLEGISLRPHDLLWAGDALWQVARGLTS